MRCRETLRAKRERIEPSLLKTLSAAWDEVAAQLSPIRFSLDHQSLVRGRMAVFWNATRQSRPLENWLNSMQHKPLHFCARRRAISWKPLKNAKRIAREVSPACRIGHVRVPAERTRAKGSFRPGAVLQSRTHPTKKGWTCPSLTLSPSATKRNKYESRYDASRSAMQPIRHRCPGGPAAGNDDKVAPSARLYSPPR